MSILFLTAGQSVKVSSISGSSNEKQHLSDLGFNPGSTVTMISKIPTGIIVRIKDSRIALDKKIASKINFN